MENNRIIRIKDVCELVSLSKSTIYRLIKKKQFPCQVRISERLIGFRLFEILKWIENR